MGLFSSKKSDDFITKEPKLQLKLKISDYIKSRIPMWGKYVIEPHGVFLRIFKASHKYQMFEQETDEHGFNTYKLEPEWFMETDMDLAQKHINILNNKIKKELILIAEDLFYKVASGAKADRDDKIVYNDISLDECKRMILES